MKKLWIYVGVVCLGLLILPLIWWEPQSRVVTTLSSGITVDLPASSQYGLADLETLTNSLTGVRSIRLEYGPSRSVLRIYPDSAVITLTAPWLIEKIRYPLGRLLESGLQAPFFTPSHVSPPVFVSNVAAWVSFDDGRCVVDQLVTFVNDSPQHIDYIDLPLPKYDWGVRSQAGDALDHSNEGQKLQIFLPQALAPYESTALLLTHDSKLWRFPLYAVAEAIILQPADTTVNVSVRGPTGIAAHELHRTQAGYWRLLFKSALGE